MKEHDIDNLLVIEFMPLAKGIAQRYKQHPVVKLDNAIDIEDIEQQAMIGLMGAISSHDSEKGPLGAWINIHVHSEICMWLRDCGCPVKIPRREMNKAKQIYVTSFEEDDIICVTSTDMTIHEAREVLEHAIEGFSPTIQKIISMRWGIPNSKPHSIAEIAEALRINPSYVYRTFKKTMKLFANNQDVKEALRVIS